MSTHFTLGSDNKDLPPAETGDQMTEWPKMDRLSTIVDEPEKWNAISLPWQEEFRRTIARELHDDLGQKLALLTMKTEELERQLSPTVARIKTRFQELRSLSDSLSEGLEQVSHQLHPSTLDHLGLEKALRSLVENFGKRESISVLLSIGRLPHPVKPETALCLYRVAQEALRNAVKHAGETQVKVALRWRCQQLTLSVRDFGPGFDPKTEAARSGLGLVSMRERAQLAGGTFHLLSRQGLGTLVWVNIPQSTVVSASLPIHLVAASSSIPNLRKETAQNVFEESPSPLDGVVSDDVRLQQFPTKELTDYAIFFVGLTGTIATWSAGVEKILGYAEPDFVGQEFAFLYSGEDQKRGLPLREVQNATLHECASTTAWHQRRDGTSLYASRVFSLVRDKSGRPLGTAILLQDATAQKSSEDQRTQIARSLTQSNEDLTRFGHIVAHDLREPLRMIESYVALLGRELDGRLDDTSRDYMSYVHQGVDHMNGLITSLLKYAQVNNTSFVPVDVSLDRIMQTTLVILEPALVETAAAVTYDVLPPVKGDPVLLLEVFQNLIANALKYRSSEAPRIHISVQSDSSQWTIAIQDNGIGINPDYAEKIFLPLTRLHGAQIPGSGIGLAVCKRALERHGGRIWVRSAVGAGSTFFFSLPKGFSASGMQTYP